MKKSMLKTLGIVILCLGLLYLLLNRGFDFKEGFEEVIDCKSVEGVRYVRLRPSLFLTGTGNLQVQITLSQVRVLNETGTNVALRKNVSVSTGNNTGAGVIVDGAAGPREIGPGQRTWQSSAGNAEEYIEIDLGAATTVASVVYMGALDGPREQNRGVRINLLNSSRQQILGAEEITKEDDVNQTVTFCKERQRFQVTFVSTPSDIKCYAQQYTNVPNPNMTEEPKGTQWLCEDENNAKKLFKGPFDKATRYLRDGDIVCVKSESGSGYNCFEPYDGSVQPSYYDTDATFNDVQDTGNQLCGRAYSYIKDISATMVEVGRTNASINTVYDTINRSETDLRALRTNMKCDTQTSGGFKTMCDSINQSLQDIEARRGGIQTVHGNLNGTVDKIQNSRTLIQDIITRFKCAIA